MGKKCKRDQPRAWPVLAPPRGYLATMVYETRMHCNLTQARLAEVLKVHICSVALWETGVRSPSGPAVVAMMDLAPFVWCPACNRARFPRPAAGQSATAPAQGPGER